MSMVKYLLMLATCLVMSCTTVPDVHSAGTQDCLPGHLLVCPEWHDKPSLDRDRDVSQFERCSCEKVSF